MTGRAHVLVATLAGVGALALTFGRGVLPLYVWNASASVPVGLYRLQSTGERYITELVAVLPPEPLAIFLADGGYLPRSVPMLKRVLALPGQAVCRKGLTVMIDAIAMGAAPRPILLPGQVPARCCPVGRADDRDPAGVVRDRVCWAGICSIRCRCAVPKRIYRRSFRAFRY